MPTAPPVPNPRGGALDALRFAAAFLIVAYHYLFQAPLDPGALAPAFQRGYLATDFFLMLSGFVLARAYGSRVVAGRLSWGDFMLRRVKRIWPPHLMVLAAFVLLIEAAAAMGVWPQQPELFRWPALVAQALLVQVLGIEAGGWNTVTWSLSALVVCYAAFPPLWRLQTRLGAPWLGLAMAAGVLAGADLLCAAGLGKSLYDLPMHLSLIRALPLFVLGLALARVAGERPLPQWAAAAAGAGALALLVLVQVIGRFDGLSIACIAAVILAAGSRPVARPWPFAAFGARLSFSLFLTHLLVATVWFGGAHALEARLTLPAEARWALWWASFPLALLGAVVFDRWADQPLQRWLNRDRSAGRAAEALAAARPS
ncbi:MAG TPA: acyltransferase [Caulobacteraceae bacterium]